LRLRLKLAILLLPPVMLPLIGIGWLANKELRDETYRAAVNQMQDGLALVTHEIDSLLTTTRANAELLAGSETLTRYLRSTDGMRHHSALQDSLARLFEDYQQAFPEYHEIRLLRSDSSAERQSLATEAPESTENGVVPAQFGSLLHNELGLFKEIRRNPNNGEHALYVYHRLQPPYSREPSSEDQDTSHDYLGVTVSLKKLFGNLEKHRIGQQGRILLVGKKDDIIFDTHHQASNTRLPVVLRQRVKSDTGIVRPSRYYLLNQPFLVLSKTFDSDLYALAAYPIEELEKPLIRPKVAVLLGTLSALILYTSLVYGGLQRMILKPLKALHLATAEIGNGNFTPSIGVESRDELGGMARSLKQMGEKLARSSEEIEYLAFHDHLTGLPNRRLFLQRLEEAIHSTQRKGGIFVLIFLDIDDFKKINDALGHQLGDELLIAFAQRMSHSLREQDLLARSMVSRLGGDEFFIMLTEIKSPFDGNVVARRILKQTQQPFELGEIEYFITVSIGMTVYPQDGGEADTLIRNADLAMYSAKAKGKNNLQYYSKSMNEAVNRRMAIETGLHKAVREQAFSLVYQPQIDLATGRIMGLEALLRWHDAQLGDMPPAEFIPVAEDTGLICEIGSWVFSEVCRQHRSWKKTAAAGIAITVNVSSTQLQKMDLLDILHGALRAQQLTPDCLRLELKESAVIEPSDPERALLEDIVELGVEITLDDFGTGYASLSRLYHLPIGSIKIDSSFIAKLPHDSDSTHIVDTIIAMAQRLGISVIAEGVENDEQLAVLRQLGCTWAQGFVFSKPLPPGDLEDYVCEYYKTLPGKS
jgi:diguanylate cyclase (GGDEF)-like protein